MIHSVSRKSLKERLTENPVPILIGGVLILCTLALFWRKIFAFLLVVWSIVWIIYTLHTGTARYEYSDHQVDATQGHVEIGTLFVTTDLGILHEHGRCFGIFRRDSRYPERMEVVYHGSTTFPDEPYRPKLESIDENGVTYIVETSGVIEYMPYRVEFNPEYH